MVLTEAFAAGTPVVASDIAGYRGVVEDGADGVLVPPGDALALAETLHDLALDPARLERLGERAGRSAEQYAWPRVTEQVLEAYDDAIAMPEPAAAAGAPRSASGCAPPPAARAAPRAGCPRWSRASARSRAPPSRRAGSASPSPPSPPPAAPTSRSSASAGTGRRALLASSPAWVLLAIALMCLSMVLRAVAWHAILRAALPASRPRFTDALQGTLIGVLMSATLPARSASPRAR